MMAKALESEGIELAHIIGAEAGHNYTPEARAEINRRIDRSPATAEIGFPHKVCFTTWTLRYNRSHWVQIDGLEQHWERARIEADAAGLPGDNGPQIKTTNISAFTLMFPCGPFSISGSPDQEARCHHRRRPPESTQASLGSLMDRPFPEGRAAGGNLPNQAKIAGFASDTAFKARSTTPSWTAS